MSHRHYGGLLGLALLLAAVAGLFLGLEVREELALGPEGTVTGAILASHHPLHARPAVETASDAQCLACHASVLEARPRAVSPAGIPASSRRAAYQETPTYQGEQESFHRRHLVTPLARSL